MAVPFLDALRAGRALLMDGAMGTELQRAGLQSGECGEAWNLTHRDWVRAIHQRYVAAGAVVLLTNSFQAHRAAPAWKDDPDPNRLIGVYRMAAALARRAAGPARWVVADIGPVVDAQSGREFPDLCAVSLADDFLQPSDAVLVETCSSPRVGLAIRRLARWRRPNRPILASLTYHRDARRRIVSRSGHPPEWFAARAAKWGADALGVNCGRDLDMSDVAEILRRYRAHTDLPLFARPNAGTPKQVRGRWVYPQTPERMAERLPELLEAGVSMVGGCCGTTPEHIAAFRPVVDAWNARRK